MARGSRQRIAALGLLVLCSCYGEETTCPQEWAPSILEVRVQGTGLEEGTWAIEVDDILCDLALPDEGSTCDAPPRFMILDGEDVLLTLFEYAPATVDLAVFHDGARVYKEAPLRPDWAEDEPNGHGCGIRRVAEVLVEL